jgi:hypothetical protein
VPVAIVGTLTRVSAPLAAATGALGAADLAGLAGAAVSGVPRGNPIAAPITRTAIPAAISQPLSNRLGSGSPDATFVARAGAAAASSAPHRWHRRHF